MRIVYLSEGDVPSYWAHSFQAMKMADALSELAVSLDLVTGGSLWRGAERNVPLRSWYDVGPGMRIVRLPIAWRRTDPFFRKPLGRRYQRLAVYWARLRRPDLVYARCRGAALRLIRAGLPTVLETHVSVKEGRFQQTLLAELARQAGHPAFLGVVTVTDYLGQQYLASGIPQEKLCVWPDAVDPAPFDRAPDRDEARRRLGLPEKAPVVVYCGHFYDTKGVPSLIDAARRAPALTFCLVGGTPGDRTRMRRQAAGVRNVRFEGFVPHRMVPVHLAAADVLVLPNSARFEHAQTTSPLKLFEYMAARRPIVATDIPALSGLLRDEENALVVEPDSPEALAAALRRLADDPGLSHRLAEQARRDVDPYTWKRRAREVLERFVHPPGR